jgi:hypothetical protein
VSVESAGEGRKLLERVTRDCQEDRPHISLHPFPVGFLTDPDAKLIRCSGAENQATEPALSQFRSPTLSTQCKSKMGLRKLERRRSTQPGGSRQGGSFDPTVKRRQRSTRQELKWKYRARVLCKGDRFSVPVLNDPAYGRPRTRLFSGHDHGFSVSSVIPFPSSCQEFFCHIRSALISFLILQ